MLVCVCDRSAGLVYGVAWRCMVSYSDDVSQEGYTKVSPYPANTLIMIACRVVRSGDLLLNFQATWWCVAVVWSHQRIVRPVDHAAPKMLGLYKSEVVSTFLYGAPCRSESNQLCCPGLAFDRVTSHRPW
ncbi:unnamed protein product [Meganyctiphanes norvegica]|uniref:Uncharacterized protein n=1 Tax=Meganyctiphanes norvegica TaxID=48144 RepID=A0AAV2RV31_MEGNR